MQFFKSTLENSRFIGDTKRYYLILDSGDKFLAIKPGIFEDNFQPGQELIIAIHKDDMHVFKAPEDLLSETSLM